MFLILFQKETRRLAKTVPLGEREMRIPNISRKGTTDTKEKRASRKEQVILSKKSFVTFVPLCENKNG
jgi:hypothetical protein